MTIQKYIHSSPRKLRLVADMVRKMQPSRALDVLRVTPKYAAKDMVKALEAVLANAKQSGLSLESMVFKSLEVNESTKMRRFRAGTRGRVKPFKKRMAHIKIVLSDEVQMKSDQVRKPVDQKANESDVSPDLSEKVKKTKVKKEAK